MLELKKTMRYKIILDTLVLKASVNGFDVIQILKGKAGQRVRSLVLIEGHDERAIKSIVTK